MEDVVRNPSNGLLRLLRDLGDAIRLLPQGRLRLGLLVIASMATALLDLIGVLLIGYLSILLVGFIQPGTGVAIAGPFGSLLPSLPSDDVTALATVGLAAGSFLIAKSVIGTYLARRILRFLASRQVEVSEDLLAGLFRLPISVIERKSSQETAFALTTGVAAAIVGLLGAASLAVSELALLLVLGLALFIVNPGVTVAAIAYFALMAAFMHFTLGTWAGRAGSQLTKSGYGLIRQIQQGLAIYRELSVTHRRNYYTSELSSLIRDYASASATISFVSLLPKYVYETALLLGALALGAIEFTRQTPTEAVGTVAVFLAAGTRIMPSMLRLQNSLISIRSSVGQAEPTAALSQLVRETQETASPYLRQAPCPGHSPEISSTKFKPSVYARDVCARYPEARTSSIRGVSLDIDAGTVVALVGPTGGGKSTLVDAMLGILPLESGRVEIGGLPPMEAVATWPGRIAYVPQAVSLVEGSVRGNVALATPEQEIDDSRVWETLASVHLAEFLRSKREGLDTLVGERGVKLSGGQRQRLGLARALYTQPQLLALDEATSALDAETEAAVNATILRLRGEATVIVVAHRLATVRDADCVLYVDGGTVISSGSFDEVRKSVPKFDQSARLLGL